MAGNGHLHRVGGVWRRGFLSLRILGCPSIMSLGSACRFGWEIAGAARLEALVSRELVSCGVTGGCLPSRRGVGCSGLMGRLRMERGMTNIMMSLVSGAGNMARRRVAGWWFRRIVAHRRRGNGARSKLVGFRGGRGWRGENWVVNQSQWQHEDDAPSRKDRPWSSSAVQQLRSGR